METHRLPRLVLIAATTASATSLLVFACASNEEDLYTVPIRTTAPGSDASADETGGAGSGTGGETGVGGLSAGGALGTGGIVTPSSGGTVGNCDPTFCPNTGFGQPCCTATGQCGIGLGSLCIGVPADAGAGGSSNPPPPGDVEVSCRSADDCSGSQVCCGVRSGGAYTAVECRNNCGQSSTTIACSRPGDCGDGEVCCGVLAEGNAMTYARLECRAECPDYVVCGDDGDCDTGSCQSSLYLPEGFTVCR